LTLITTGGRSGPGPLMWRRSSCIRHARRNTDSAGAAGASAPSASRASLTAVLWRPRQAQKKVICKFKLWAAAILNLCKLTTFPVSKSWRLFIWSSEGP